MSILKGGRGRRAPYQTTQVRCPLPLKPFVTQIIQRFHEAVDTNPNTSIEELSKISCNLNTGLEAPQPQIQIQAPDQSSEELDTLQAECDRLKTEVEKLGQRLSQCDRTRQETMDNLHQQKEEMEKLRTERNELEKECNRLGELVPDLNLEVAILKERIQDMQLDVGQLPTQPQPDPYELLNELKRRRKRTSTNSADIKIILDLLGLGDGE